jgi:REP element-mobilizing transposase RayT
MATVGIHLAWTAYGTWLPGDDRGHWSPLFDEYDRILERGGRLAYGDPISQFAARERMTEPAKILNTDDRLLVADKIGSLAGGPNQPRAYAAAIEETHVHLLLGPVAEKIHKTAGRIKGTTSSALLKLPANRGRSHIWTARYWKVFLYDDAAFVAVKRYIEEHNLRRGITASPFPWISRM